MEPRGFMLERSRWRKNSYVVQALLPPSVLFQFYFATYKKKKKKLPV